MNFLSFFKTKLTPTILALALCATQAAAMKPQSLDDIYEDKKESTPTTLPQTTQATATMSVLRDESLDKKQEQATALRAWALEDAKMPSTLLTNPFYQKLQKSLYDTLDSMPTNLINIIICYVPYEVEGKLERTLKAYTRRVGFCQLPNNHIASAAFDCTISIVDLTKGETCVKTLTGHQEWVLCITLLPNGHLASGSDDKTIKIWDLNKDDNKACVKTLTGHQGSISCITQLPNGNIASGSHDKTIKIWDLTTGVCVKTLMGHQNAVYCITLLSIGYLASGASDKTTKIWDLNKDDNKACVKTLTGHQGSVYCIIQLANGYLATASNDGSFKIWS